MRGQYEFPFSFVLPFGVQPSMACRIGGENGGSCEVIYTLEARIHRRGWIKWDIHTKKPVTVASIRDPMTVPRIQGFVQPHEEKVFLCCCINRGTIGIGMNTPSTSLSVRDQFSANYVIENNSTAKVKAVEFRVMEHIHWSAGGHTMSHSHEAFYVRLQGAALKGDVNTVYKRGVAPGDSVKMVERLMAMLEDNMGGVRGQINAKYSTFNGTLIQVRHALEMKVCTAFGSSNPTISIPLILYFPSVSGFVDTHTGREFPQPSAPEHTAVPSDWHAQVYAPVALPVPMYTKSAPVNSEHEVPTSIDAPAPYNPAASGFPDLLHRLNTTFDAPSAFSSWLGEGSNSAIVESLSPADFSQLFGAIRTMLDQVIVAERIAANRSRISCQHIAAAAAASFDVVRTDVVARLAEKVSDKENIAAVKQVLTPYQFIVVEKHLK